MNTPVQTEASREFEANIKSILEWLALAHGRTGLEEASGLQKQLLILRSTPLPPTQRIKFLDLLYGQAAKVTLAQLPALHQATLPISRKVRQLVRVTQNLLEILTQDYLTTLADLFDPQQAGKARSPHTSLWRAMRCLSWHLMISHLVAAPAGKGIWQQFHGAFRTARQLGLDDAAAPGEQQRIKDLYLSRVLAAIAQPASFTSLELEFIGQYVDGHSQTVGISDEAPAGHEGIFWIDPDRDTPAHALARRLPPPETKILYLACDTIGQGAASHLAALEKGLTAAQLGLPPFAETRDGHGVLRRLSGFWSRPARRKFPRRRQSYRADLCTGLEKLWQLLQTPDGTPATSEWMITNESPDGYAMMHVAGETDRLRVGDIVALRPRKGENQPAAGWHICIVRWALSENPEHIELGLQVLAARAVPVRLAQPQPQEMENSGFTTALLLPETPPLRPLQALVVPAGTVSDQSRKLILLVEQDNLSIRELRATQLDEQTSSIDVFTVEPDETL